MKEARTKYMSNLVLENASNPKSLFKLIGSFLNKPMKNPLPEHTSDQQSAEDFNTYFTNKTLHIHNNLILINRIEKSVGIKGNALKWFVSHLKGRRQCVIINNASSQFADIKFGVPQGSVLGPILFSLYTLPLAGILKQHGVSYHLYADDTQLYMSFKPSNENENKTMGRVINCIDDVKTWMITNLLKLKTEFTIFGTQQQFSKINRNSIVVAGNNVEITTSARNLGIRFDNVLSMNEQITEMTKQAFRDIRIIQCARKYLTLDATTAVVQCLVCSKLDFCNNLYYGLPSFQIQKLQRLQNSAARLILRQRKFEHITPI